jgi:hypothetical protein
MSGTPMGSLDGSKNLNTGVEVESACPFDKLRAPSKVEGLALAATRSRSLNCGI